MNRKTKPELLRSCDPAILSSCDPCGRGLRGPAGAYRGPLGGGCLWGACEGAGFVALRRAHSQETWGTQGPLKMGAEEMEAAATRVVDRFHDARAG
jgi:hypothetical protein